MDPIDIANRRELFLDHVLIDRFEGGAGLEMHPPKREEIVFQAAGPLENACSGVYSALVKLDEAYLLTYRGRYPIDSYDGDTAQEQTANVAVSVDGIHFDRPELGLYDFGDGGLNNVVWQGIQAHNLVPFRDTNPACREAERYKAVGGTGQNNLYGLVSPDGFHWRLVQDAPLDIAGAFDSANVPFWDSVIGKYRLFSRTFADGRRSIQSCTSDDFVHWTEPVPHVYDEDAPAQQFYTNATTPVPGAEHILVSFPMRYVAERNTPVADTSGMDYPGTGKPGMAGMTDAVMMSSRDGVHWHRPFLDAWLRPGLDERNWTHRNTTPAIGILPLKENAWSMYVSEHYGWPDNRLRRVSLRPWGFGSIHAGYRGGEVVTKPLTFAGSELRINFATSAVGSVRVEVQDAEGRAIPGYGLDDMAEIYGDELERPVAWKGGGEVGQLAGRPVRLRFVLRDADVFSFRFSERS